ncbi:glycerophosphodiester phosphodiesterase [uncultured Tenacibaculum sp.]|uniref:glycerophosphodiester phosphodiesterase n=1 Tax=uncultured Tenacibaculum sp. TaxID=174713 RepID=UPI00260A1B37|nr:glycerophosphodiester phosphodiesterase [uncultured Tenacibaculum sp.]
MLFNKSKVYILVLLVFLSCNNSTMNKEKSKKIVIAHRGASGYLPEHTMEAKAMAYAMNPDYIEQDLVLSKDDVPIVIHDIYLDDVTNVAQIYPDKKREDGRYYVIDFTFNELQQLQVTERFNPKTEKQFYPKRFPKGKGSFKLHSFQQEIELIQGLNYSTGKNIGIYPEIKNPEFHRQSGKNIAKIVLEILADYDYKTKEDKCIFQCFDANELERVRKELKSELFLVQLIEYPEETTQLAHFATYADGIGPWYKQILDSKVNEVWKFTSLVEDAHKLGLVVHPYTYRADQLEEFASFNEMMQVLFYEANVDGGFTDFPDKMVSFLFK